MTEYGRAIQGLMPRKMKCLVLYCGVKVLKMFFLFGVKIILCEMYLKYLSKVFSSFNSKSFSILTM